MDDDYVDADEAASEFWDEIKTKNNLTMEQKQKMWENKRNSLEKKVQTALPVNVTHIENVVNNGSALFSLLPDVIRSQEWLEENGQCMDNIMPRPSKVQYGGIGAFATCYISNNTVVTPVSLLILNKTQLQMYELTHQNNFEPPKKASEVVTGHQLALNYCFSHRDSTLAFFPYSSTAHFINHSSQKPNAQLRWSKNKLHQSQWLDLPPKKLLKKASGLLLDVVATQDISPGDEIRIDYGNDWQNAWNKYVSEWKPQPSAHVSLNSQDNFQNITSTSAAVNVIRTLSEQKTNPYPINIQTACYYHVGDEEKEEGQLEKEEKNDRADLKLYWDLRANHLKESYLRPCDILERTSSLSTTHNSKKYTARIYEYNSDDTEEESIFPLIVHDIPRIAIRFLSKPYMSNQLKKKSFRHFIGIPDDIFPSKWKNIKQKST